MLLVSPLEEERSGECDKIINQSSDTASGQGSAELNVQKKLDRALYDKAKESVDNYIFIDEIDGKFADAVKLNELCFF